MRRLRAAIVALSSLLVCLLASAAQADPDHQDFATIERGRYLALMGDCEACHTEAGGASFAGGRPIETPFGTILSSNITPDRATGIGAWSEQDFYHALHEGVGRGGKNLYPAMPYAYTTRATREDVRAIQAYLATVPAVRHAVDEDTLAFPLDIRALMDVWNWLFFKPGTWHPDPARSAQWNRGAYLATGLDHCGMCHTPKNLLGADRTSLALRGYRLQGWFAPDITDDARRGLAGWSIADIVAYLQTGHNRFAAASGPMAEEIVRSSQHATTEDLHAIAVYLKQQPATADSGTQRVAADDSSMRAGAAIYTDRCSACHAPDGSGIPGLFPRLRGSAAVQQRDPISIIRVVLQGVRSAATRQAPTAPAMPSFAWNLGDHEIADVATFIRNAWGNAAPRVTAESVAADRTRLERRTAD